MFEKEEDEAGNSSASGNIKKIVKRDSAPIIVTNSINNLGKVRSPGKFSIRVKRVESDVGNTTSAFNMISKIEENFCENKRNELNGQSVELTTQSSVSQNL